MTCSCADLGHQTLETFSISRAGPRLSKIIVDHDNPIKPPAQRCGAFPQCILAVNALGVRENLTQP
jgi:hypothetical protein